VYSKSFVISGTILNVATILAGGTLGSLFGAVLPARFQQIMVQALGLSVLLIGTQMALKTTNVLFPLLGILFGGLIGEAIGIEAALERLGEWFQRRLSSRAGAVAQGFVTASLVFCIGPLAILGALQNGLTGDTRLLAIKSVLDGFASFGFAATFGPGVLLSALSVGIYQGGISLGAGAINALVFSHLSHPQFINVIAEMTAVGGLMVIAVGLRLLQIAELRIGNFLPGIVVAPVLALFAHTLHLTM